MNLECQFENAKGLHLYVPFHTPSGRALEACYGCGKERTEGKEHFECDCVPGLGPSHCHGCSEDLNREVSWEERRCG